MHDTNYEEKEGVPTELLQSPGHLPSKKHSVMVIFIACLVITVFGSITLLSVTRAEFHQKPLECFEAACPDNWIGFQRKCFYFSDDTKNWTFSKRFCDSQDADLVQVETLQELDFLLRYKGPSDHWIGLSREQDQPWKWINGTEWSRCFPIKGGGECAYLNDKGASSARRYTERKWICSRPDRYTQIRRQSSS
ncbi:C-type lectin domain family 2 member D [Rhinolophus ferrumequinum]|uniref:C-type lectin domain family 2 member D n=1 Tax=Rhinolophus ferrumequinum TaxID=59479 RepID=A0A671EUE3_RHIFE|nr:C-type lectin domain family 2 member D isoform X1 [Rhinolophus ferrumequinum]KAF6339087.1 C-type lectin domain family 2 member D [Rhinolophus ferrumequinum]